MKRTLKFDLAECISRGLSQGRGRPIARMPYKVINLGRADFDAALDANGRLVVVIKPRLRVDAIEFPDGSIGTEWGPEDGSNIQRKVELPRGGWAANTSPEDWSGCEAALWVRNAGAEWTMIYQPVSNYPGAVLAGANVDGCDERFVSRVEGVDAHDLD